MPDKKVLEYVRNDIFGVEGDQIWIKFKKKHFGTIRYSSEKVPPTR